MFFFSSDLQMSFPYPFLSLIEHFISLLSLSALYSLNYYIAFFILPLLIEIKGYEWTNVKNRIFAGKKKEIDKIEEEQEEESVPSNCISVSGAFSRLLSSLLRWESRNSVLERFIDTSEWWKRKDGKEQKRKLLGSREKE